MYVIKFRPCGEIWEISDENMQARSGHYFRLALHDLKWFYHCITEELPENGWAEAIIYHNDRHMGGIYYKEDGSSKSTSWHWWRDRPVYHASCFKFVHK